MIVFTGLIIATTEKDTMIEQTFDDFTRHAAHKLSRSTCNADAFFECMSSDDGQQLTLPHQRQAVELR